MKSGPILWLCLGFALFGNACTSSNPSTTHPPVVDSRQAQRVKVLAYLRDEGIMSPGTKLESAEWSDNTKNWLVILQHPTGQVSHWFVNAAADDYSGGTCMH
jgi:hypothetical protein